MSAPAHPPTEERTVTQLREHLPNTTSDELSLTPRDGGMRGGVRPISNVWTTVFGNGADGQRYLVEVLL